MATAQDFGNWELDKLSDYITDTHHVFARKASAQLMEIGNKLREELDKKQPEFEEITENFKTLSKDLEDHMAGEEKYLFPYIKKLLNAKREGNKMKKPGFGSLETPLKNHYADHDKADKLMQKIKGLTKGYTLAEDASENISTYYDRLKEFESDLEQHIYVENEVLFGKALELEKEVVE